MKSIFILLFSILVSIPAWNQELSKKEQKKLLKELKKEQKAEEAAEKAEFVNLMVHQRRFVLEAERLRDSRGNTSMVSSVINFIAADSLSGVIQIGSNRYVGLNGVGGITVEGRVSNYKYTRNEKNSSHYVSYNVSTTSGTFDVMMTAYPDGKATATITSNWPGRLTYIGYLVPPNISRVYKGVSY